MNDLKNMDLNQKHIYNNTSAIPGTIRDYTQKHNKPYVIGEAGYEWDWSKNFNDFAEDIDDDFKPVSEMNRMMLEAGKGKFGSFAVKTNLSPHIPLQ